MALRLCRSHLPQAPVCAYPQRDADRQDGRGLPAGVRPASGRLTRGLTSLLQVRGGRARPANLHQHAELGAAESATRLERRLHQLLADGMPEPELDELPRHRDGAPDKGGELRVAGERIGERPLRPTTTEELP